MEQLRGQLVDSVRNVVLENPLERRQQVLAKGETVPTSSKMWPWPKSTESNSQQYQQEQVPKPIREPFSDLWTMAGQDHGVGSSSGHHSTSATSGAKSLLRRLGESALPASDHISTMTNMGSGQPLSTAPLGSTMSSFSTKLLENVVEGCLMDFREGIRNDIQNMHLELLRQFQIQKMEVETLLKKYSDLGELKDEIERLQEENRQLRLNY
ncbi:Protein nedd1 [Lunasporangiospora selenospora]|uniref:Protein nedd1 n=1 Tax=Lunasporangiospora selenospora TaxID=979761 RepID=A0A9P6KIL1_9FUNG|nr:Protein nedd1 [Lunasporangiospora selenospora]